jgi:adenylate cyclase
MSLKSDLNRFVPPIARPLLGLGPETSPAGECIDVTILFTDLDDYSVLTDRSGDDAAHRRVRAHNRIVRRALESHGGMEVKHTGDGIMAWFPAARRALECAIDIETASAARNVEHPEEPLAIAIGINTGAPVYEDGDLYGTAVITAARITDLADGGQVLVSEVVRLLAAGKGFRFLARGPRELEGMREPVTIHELDWRAASAVAA